MMNAKYPAEKASEMPRAKEALQGWKTTAIAAAIAVALSYPAHDAHALALGRITVLSALGEPLRAEIELPEINEEEASSLRTTVAGPEAFRSAGLEYNAALNDVPPGAGPGQLTMLIAAGMDHPLLEARGPYDLIVANILAGPLIALAPDFAGHLVPGGHLLLAGLLETQENDVRAACRRAGLRLGARLVNGDWSILWLRKRERPGRRHAPRRR